MRDLRAIALALAGAVLMAAPVEAHGVHAGVTEISVNPRTSEMEITHRVYVDDLLTALGDETLDAEAYFSDPDKVAGIGNYIASVFRFADPTGLLYEPSYVGAELDGEFAWVYFVAPVPDDTSGFIVDNDILADTFDDQAMMTNFRFNSHVRTALQGPGRRDPVRVRFD